jgi:thiosulfate/3-mercaptopyruvate sulfurtransferase
VSAEWRAEHLRAAQIRIFEVDGDTSSYAQGHIPGAVGWNWQTQPSNQVRRDLSTKRRYNQLTGEAGVTPTTTVVFYGDNHNWFATDALWQFRYWGHSEDRLRLLNGGRSKWLAERRALVKDIPAYPPTRYQASFPDDNVRVTKDLILQSRVDSGRYDLIDVRSPDEFTGKVIAPPGMSETAQRGGHIPGTASISCAQTVKEDSTFKSVDALQALYTGQGVSLDREIIAYCRIGERSSPTWFVLKYLLGVPKVRNYDGSWTE